MENVQFFRNLKSLPPPGTEEFNNLIDWEIQKILGGITLKGGVYIPGWLYWHLNHWHIRIDEKDEFGNELRVKSLPILRDNEWKRADALEKCRIQKKGYMEIGARQGGKSEMEASFFGMNATLFENTQNIIVCGNDNDLSLLKDKVDFGLKNLWEGISIPRLDKTWRSNQVRLGYKTPNGDDEIWSYIVIRNAKDGHNTEVSAGTTAKSFIMDEVGKYSFSQAYEAGVPAMKGRFGFRAIPILVGTGGSFDNGKDAENFFYNPEANNFLGFLDEETGKETCMFLSGLYRQDCKYETTLAEFLQKEKGMAIPKDSEAWMIPMLVTDKELAEATITKEREQAKLNPDKTIYLKKVMYFPLTPSECFLSNAENLFDAEAARRQKVKLMQQNISGTPVVLYDDGDGVKHQFTDKFPITNFPLNATDSKDAPVMIYEFPVDSPPFGLYVAGVDPYRQGKAAYSSSLGAVYIYKRMHSITSENYQDMFVASYVARPDKKETWEEQARLLIKYYNARTLCENDEISFIDYMISKGDAHYLEKQPEWLKEIIPNSTVRRDYGIHRSADRVREFLHNSLKKYSEEVLYRETNEEGDVINEVKGMSKILDPMLLEEMIKYTESDGNFDRIVAAELAVALAMKMNPLYGRIGGDEMDPRMKAFISKKTKSTIFPQSRGTFNNNKRKLFV